MICNLDIPIPRQWPRQVKSAFLYSVSFASATFTCASGMAANRKDKMKWLQTELAQVYREICPSQRGKTNQGRTVPPSGPTSKVIPLPHPAHANFVCI